MLWCAQPVQATPPPPTFDARAFQREVLRESLPVITAPLGMLGAAALLGPAGSVLASPALLYAQRCVIRGNVVRLTKSLHGRRVKHLDGKNVMITGASTGIGAQLAIQLALLGANVIGVVRRPTDEARAYMEEVLTRQWVGGDPMTRSMLMARMQFAQADFANLDHVRRLVAETASQEWADPSFKKGKGGLHVLINAAGTWETGAPSRTMDGAERHMQVNYLAPFMLTEGLAPIIAAARDDAGFLGGRVINITSSAHVAIPDAAKARQLMEECGRMHQLHGAEDATIRPEGQPVASGASNVELYALSKLLQILHSDSLASRGVCSVSVAPGAVLTDMYRHVAPQLLRYLQTPMTALFMKTPTEGSATAFDCTLRDDLVNGGFYANMKLRPGRSEAACDGELRRHAIAWTLRQLEMRDPEQMTAEEIETARPHSLLYRTHAGNAKRISANVKRPPLMPKLMPAAEA
jgi:NAD(P)-dependent dehydrogenase (short-subunit alcohol dehydrogenase family)